MENNITNNKTHMTALISAFARAYHSKNNITKIYDDYLAEKLIGDKDYDNISMSMTKGASFFNPDLANDPKSALRWIVDNQLSPSPLGRAKFTEKSLETAIMTGTKQYIICGAGFDTFAYRQPVWAENIDIFELDINSMTEEKRQKLSDAQIDIPFNVQLISTDFNNENWVNALLSNKHFNNKLKSFCSLNGLIYYLSEETFRHTLSVLSSIFADGSTIVFDYPDENSFNSNAGERAKKQSALANSAGEKMLACFSYKKIEKLLSDYGLLIYEHLNPLEITEQLFSEYNNAEPDHKISAFDNVNYCLAVKKQI